MNQTPFALTPKDHEIFNGDAAQFEFEKVCLQHHK